MSPTIVTRDARLVLLIGSPGGSRIITLTLEAIINMVDHGMDVQAAINAPRLHEQWLPDVIYVEPFALSPDTRALLETRARIYAAGRRTLGHRHRRAHADDGGAGVGRRSSHAVAGRSGACWCHHVRRGRRAQRSAVSVR